MKYIISSGILLIIGSCVQTFPADGPEGSELSETNEGGSTDLSSCEKPCLHGGTCLPTGRCLCLDEYEGDQCENARKTCKESPIRPLHAMMFTNGSHGQVQCNQGFQIEEGLKQFNLECVNDTWLYGDKGLLEAPECLPICNPKCQNGGVCINPNSCSCPPNFIGAVCEEKFCVEEKPDLDDVLDKMSTGQLCDEGFKFNKAKARLEIVCTDHEWVVEYNQIHCEAVCEPPCEHGGKCFAPDMCLCQGSFHGDRCEHRRCVDTPKRLPYSKITPGDSEATMDLECIENYHLSSGNNTVSLSCIGGHWEFDDPFSEDNQPSCQPICSFPCANGGTCTAPDTCRCPEGFTGSFCERRFSMTISGQRCQFPFKYLGQTFLSCTSADRTHPWCATKVDLEGTAVETGICYADLKMSKVIETRFNLPCVMPDEIYTMTQFRHCVTDENFNNVTVCPNDVTGDVVNVTEVNYCLNETDSKSIEEVILTRDGSPCLVSNEGGTPLPGTYDQCLKEIHELKLGGFPGVLDDSSLTLITSLGNHQYSTLGAVQNKETVGRRRCVFPFRHREETHFDCVPDDLGVRWCATKIDSSWNVLQSDFCLPNYERYLQDLLIARNAYKGLKAEENLLKLIDDVKNINDFHFLNLIQALGWQRFYLMLQGHRVYNTPPHMGTTLKYVDEDQYLSKMKKDLLIPTEQELKAKGVEGILSLFGRNIYKENQNRQIELDHERGMLQDKLVLFLKSRKITLPSLMRDAYVMALQDFDFGVHLKRFPSFGYNSFEENSTIEDFEVNSSSVLDFLAPVSSSDEICVPFLYRSKWLGYGSCVQREETFERDFVCAIRTDGKGVPLVFSPCRIQEENTGFWLPYIPNPTTYPDKHVVLTTSGERCVFPFKHAGTWHFTCVSTQLQGNLKVCPTSINDDWTPNEIQICDLDAENIEKEMTKVNKGESSSNLVVPSLPSNFSLLSPPLEQTHNGASLETEWFTNYEDSGNPSPIYKEGNIPPEVEWKSYQPSQHSNCVFPFVYRGIRYNECIDVDTEYHWCATHVDTFGVPLYGEYCNDYDSDWRLNINQEEECSDENEERGPIHSLVFTTEGLLCRFPFWHSGKWHHECIEDFDTQWCQIRSEEGMTSTAVCRTEKQVFRKEEFGLVDQWTVTGKMCVLPFTFSDQVHTECVPEYPGSVEKWCPIEIDVEGHTTKRELCDLGVSSSFESRRKSLHFPFFR